MIAMKIDRCPLTVDEKRRLIAEEAYYRYKKRGGTGGDSTEDWLEAEAEIEKHLNEFCLANPRKPGFAGNQRLQSELANFWSGRGAYFIHHASQNIKSWINRQHGNGK
jgi:hypothetical protein